jgi:hypothetical protein
VSIVVGANIGRGAPPAVVKRNIVKIRRAFAVDPLVLWQEINEADAFDQMAMIRKVFGPRYEHAAANMREPISVPKTEFEPGKTRVSKIMDGVAVSKPGPASPNRFVITSMATPKGCEEEVAFVNTHFANFPPGSDKWDQCLRGLRNVLDVLHENGVTAVWEGDTNAEGRMPKVHPKERRIISTRDDYMGIVPGRTRVIVHGTGKVRMTIDGHDGIWARMQFRDRRGNLSVA